jgi:predicted small lipoprotein YifL
MRIPLSKSVVPRLATLLLLLLLAGLAGCGQKGPLTLPAPASAASAGSR